MLLFLQVEKHDRYSYICFDCLGPGHLTCLIPVLALFFMSKVGEDDNLSMIDLLEMFFSIFILEKELKCFPAFPAKETISNNKSFKMCLEEG